MKPVGLRRTRSYSANAIVIRSVHSSRAHSQTISNASARPSWPAARSSSRSLTSRNQASFAPFLLSRVTRRTLGSEEELNKHRARAAPGRVRSHDASGAPCETGLQSLRPGTAGGLDRRPALPRAGVVPAADDRRCDRRGAAAGRDLDRARVASVRGCADTRAAGSSGARRRRQRDRRYLVRRADRDAERNGKGTVGGQSPGGADAGLLRTGQPTHHTRVLGRSRLDRPQGHAAREQQSGRRDQPVQAPLLPARPGDRPPVRQRRADRQAAQPADHRDRRPDPRSPGQASPACSSAASS